MGYRIRQLISDNGDVKTYKLIHPETKANIVIYDDTTSQIGTDINTVQKAIETLNTKIQTAVSGSVNSITATNSAGTDVSLQGDVKIRAGTGVTVVADNAAKSVTINSTGSSQAITGVEGDKGAVVSADMKNTVLQIIGGGAGISTETVKGDKGYVVVKINNTIEATEDSTTGNVGTFIFKKGANEETIKVSGISDAASLENNAKLPTSAQVTKAISDAIGGVTSIEYKIVASLPETGENGIIYLVAHTHGTQDSYDEYIWLGDKFEKIGNTDIDLSDYVKNTTTIAGINLEDNITKAELQTALDFNTKQDTITGGISTGVTKNFTPARAIISDDNGKLAVSDIRTLELGYLSGVTSAIQDQLDGKANTSHADATGANGKATGTAYGHVKIADTLTNDSETAASTKAVKSAVDGINTTIAGKQDKLTAGAGISVADNVVKINNTVTAGTYSAVQVAATGLVTKGAQMIEVGTDTAQTDASASLAIGGLFFQMIE